MIRNILAVVSGLVLGGLLVAVVEFLGQLIYPPPPGLDINDPEALAAAMANAPTGALLFVILAWGVGAFGGGWLAAWMARPSGTIQALTVGGLLMAAGLFNLITIPSPLWFWVAGLIVFLPAAYAGARLAQRRAVVG